MRAEQVVVCTMYAYDIASLGALGVPIRQAAPREGYRAFAGLLSVSAAVTNPVKLDACYAFLNWWHSGFAGSVLLRAGYYSAVQATSRRFMAPGEYAYWIEGKPADRAYPGPFGDNSAGAVACATAGRSPGGRAGSRAGTRHRRSSSTFSNAGRSSSPASKSPGR
jgi:putative spermidine/putrescine transport system substrate-binding protein